MKNSAQPDPVAQGRVVYDSSVGLPIRFLTVAALFGGQDARPPNDPPSLPSRRSVEATSRSVMLEGGLF
jgi:hypothetical protein